MSRRSREKKKEKVSLRGESAGGGVREGVGQPGSEKQRQIQRSEFQGVICF